MLRGPGQKGQDPFQFVSTKGGDDMAEEAKTVLNIAQQQKVQYNKMLENRNTQKFVEHEPWQADLDTWRRKRKDRLVKNPENEKDEVLRICSPNTEDSNNDSGIENRAAGSPSTSLDFSPRSTELLISPKSEKDSAIGTPSPQIRTSRLDQVLIPLNVHKSRSASHQEELRRELEFNEPYTYTEKTRKIVESMPVVKSSSTAYAEGTFQQPIRSNRFKEIVTNPLTNDGKEDDENIELTVELNREQKATVVASKFPKNQPLLQEKAPEPKTPPPAQTTTVHRIYHAVDIPFDESPVSYAPRKNHEDGLFTLNVEMGSYPIHKGFGLSSTRRDGRYIVDSVIVSSPADRAGFLVGDEIISIDGIDLSDKFESAYHRMVQESARNGDALVQIRRQPINTPTHHHTLPKQSSFEKARSMFNEVKTSDSYADFKRKHSRGSSTSSRSSRDFNSLPRNASQHAERKRDNSLSSYRTAAEDFDSRHQSMRSDRADYKVTSLHDRGTPGKLSNFVPEVDRSREEEEEFRRGVYTDSREEPTLIRNYRLSNGSDTRVNVTVESRRQDSDASVDATLRRATLPRKGRYWNDYGEEEEEEVQPISPPPQPRSRSQLTFHEETRNRERSAHSETRHYYSYNDLSPEDMRRHDYYSVQGRNSRVDDHVSPVTHRFYDRDGNHIDGRRDRSTDVEILRDYGRYDYRRRREEERQKEIDMWERRNYGYTERKEYEEQRNWREVIDEQRQAAPGRQANTHGLAEHTSSLQNLPTYINRRLEQQREKEYGGYRETPIVEKFEREEYNRHEQGTLPQQITHNHSSSSQKTEVREQTTTTEERRDENVVAVSGKHKCSHCNEELGRGAAMIIESLSLFYHLSCFKCYACKTSLGSGNAGTDVRVRDGHLHCQKCYNSDKVKLSKV